MPQVLESRIMRTTLNIDGPILDELKELSEESGKPLGRVASDLLVEALHLRRRGSAPRTSPPSLDLVSKRMDALVDVDDMEAVYAVTDRTARRPPGKPSQRARRGRKP